MTAALHPLLAGELELEGRILPASNATFYGRVTSDEGSIACVYKPVAGERPLWDFPDGTLARREVAAYVVSEALGWDVVPPTVLRDGPAGHGMVQAWREPDPGQSPVDIVPRGRVPAGFLHVLDARDGDDEEVSLVHEDSAPLRRMAVFDVLVNNADRKGGHCLRARADGHVWGIDHGLTFHVADKLRTVIWDFAGEPVPDEIVETLRCALDALHGPLGDRLADLLAPAEVDAVEDRTLALLRAGVFPAPDEGYHTVPWPLV
jgi:uncharacterized repeat protein (TIGR03843 family)